MAIAAILGSAFSQPTLDGEPLIAVDIQTRHGLATLHRHPRRRDDGEPAWLLFRHGVPHATLPTQINWRAHAAALAQVGVNALLVTSSVGVLDRAVPLDVPLLVGDILMADNRLPDGSACTMFVTPQPGQGHLVLDDGLLSTALSAQVSHIVENAGFAAPKRVDFAWVMGPRTKSAAENRMWARLGAQVNSMTLGPEVVLAAELGIPCAGLVVGHKYSLPDVHERLESPGITASLTLSRAALETLVATFLFEAQPVADGNRLYRFDEGSSPG